MWQLSSPVSERRKTVPRKFSALGMGRNLEASRRSRRERPPRPWTHLSRSPLPAAAKRPQSTKGSSNKERRSCAHRVVSASSQRKDTHPRENKGLQAWVTLRCPGVLKVLRHQPLSSNLFRANLFSQVINHLGGPGRSLPSQSLRGT